MMSLLPFIISHSIHAYHQATNYVNDLTGRMRSISITFHLNVTHVREKELVKNIILLLLKHYLAFAYV